MTHCGHIVNHIVDKVLFSGKIPGNKVLFAGTVPENNSIHFFPIFFSRPICYEKPFNDIGNF